jgi:hypothetical protein
MYRSIVFKCFPVIFISVMFLSCTKNKTLFNNIEGGESGINFNNKITESESINPLDRSLMYNGGGIAVGDFNNDGLPDLFFTGNQVQNGLYINKGNLKFQDVTTEASVGGQGNWCTGATVVDINQDGLQDIYVCTSMKIPGSHAHNLLYINQGTDKNGVPVFKEMAAEYGLADTGDGVMAAFLDYDNDGDLDMYLVKTMEPNITAQFFKEAINDGSSPSTDKLYRNDWNDSLHHPVFTDVSKQARITDEGYGHGIAIADINGDGWKDIYVSNDFIGSDQLYINNHDGTFTNKIHDYFKHCSFNAMGNDIADLNNDGLPDVVTLDMDAEDNYRKKMNMDGNSLPKYYNMYFYKYEPQFVRNTLQLNRGAFIKADGSKADPVFSETGFYSGIQATDWSWSVLCADFDNDGYKDMAITNGYPRDITDHDYGTFLYQTTKQQYALPNDKTSNNHITKKQLTDPIPSIKISNYMFKNAGNMKFEDVSEKWGILTPSFSNGAVYVDLDNDGDLDYVVNNVNGEAMVYENTINKEKTTQQVNYLRIKFKGSKYNRDGIGAEATVFYDKGKSQYIENSPYRGYLSTIENLAHFGLGTNKLVDSILICWPGKEQKYQLIKNIKANQVLTVDIANAKAGHPIKAIKQPLPIFKDESQKTHINVKNNDKEFYELGNQRMMPHGFSQYGPCMAAGDVNGDGLDDIFVGGTSTSAGYFLVQRPNGTFTKNDLPVVGKNGVFPENMACLLFDADNDGDLDLYVTCGVYDGSINPELCTDRLYLNDGKGHFTLANVKLPFSPSYKFCLKAADFNHDGKLDIFIGSRGVQGKYPLPGENMILRNDSHDGKIAFTNVTDQIAPGLKDIGMVSDAIWTDSDNNGWEDLFVVGEWMSPVLFVNHNGTFKIATVETGLGGQTGWWNSIASGDFNNDGKTDYVLGNLGENSYYKASEKYPIRLYAGDFNGDGNITPVLSTYFISKKNKDGTNGPIKEFTAQNHDDVVSRMPSFKKRFLRYSSFAEADLHTILTDSMLKKATIKKVTNLSTCIFINQGNNKFTIKPLPAEAQYAPVFGIVCEDFNGDGNEDIFLNGNDYGSEVSLGPYDAFNGLLLTGDGSGGFTTVNMSQSGINIPGDGKAAVKLRTGGKTAGVAVSQNKGALQLYSLQNKTPLLNLLPNDAAVYFKYKNGKVRKEEIQYGSSALSESSRFCLVGKNVASAVIIDFSGKSRTKVF